MSENQTLEEKLAIQELCKADFYFFVRYAFKHRKGFKWYKNWHHKTICDKLTDVYYGRCSRLIINIPPRYSKTDIVVIAFIAWSLGKNPDSEFIHPSYSKTLATLNSHQIRDIVQQEWYQEIFPDVKLRTDSNKKDEWRTDKGGCVYATGTEGTITGFGAGKMREGFGGAIICFPYDELVHTEKGLLKIGDIVENKLKLKTWSVNLKTNEKELKPIDGWFKNPKSEIVKVTTKRGNSFSCTPCHKIYTQNRGYIQAKNLLPSDKLFVLFPNSFERMHRYIVSAANSLSISSIATNFYNIVAAKLSSFYPRISSSFLNGMSRPRFTDFNLSNGSTINVKLFGNNFCRSIIKNDFLCNFSGYFGIRSSLIKGKRSMTDSILHIIRFCSVTKVCNVVVSRVPIKVTNLCIGERLFPNKCRNNGLMNVNSFTPSRTKARGYPVISLSIFTKFEKFFFFSACRSVFSNYHAFVAHCSSKIRNAISSVCSINDSPLFITSHSYASSTYCINVRDNNNLFVSQGQGVLVSNCDDPHKAGDATSDVKRGNVIEWYGVTLESRLNKKETPIIVIMQRLHEEDLSGWLLAGGNGEKWDHLCIPAINDEGKPLWEEKQTLSELRRLEKANSYVFSGQYMQNPSPIGGGILKDAWWQYYTVLPDIQYSIIVADTAMKAKEQHDYSVFMCWGMGVNKNAYLIDLVRGKWEAPELEQAFVAFWNKHKHNNNLKLNMAWVEDKASGTGLIQKIKRDYKIPINGIKRDSQDKVSRVINVVGYIESGYAFLPKDSYFNSDLLAECRMFPNGKHDDQIDVVSDSLDLLYNKKKTYRSRVV